MLKEKRKALVWQIERKLAEDGVRPVIMYFTAGNCRQPYVKGLTLMSDAALPPRKHSLLDRLYQRFNAALDRLLHAVGLPPTPTSNENKILVHAPINA